MTMGIDLGSVGAELGPFERRYAFRDLALYALALGAGPDDLDYVVESPAPKLLPTFGVVPAVEPVFAALRRMGADTVQMLHLEHRTEQLAPLPPGGVLRTHARIARIWDALMGALAVVETETAVDGSPCCRTRWQILLRGAGRFGGERPPPGLRTRPPEGAPPAFELELATRPEQALLYRLLGDLNPVHARPEVARQAGFGRPILHGLCTYGIAARLALRALARDEPQRFRAFEARFAKVVLPGDTLIVRGYPLAQAGQAAITVSVRERGEEAIANALFEYDAAP
jgi:acyl dehydratase